MLCRQFYVKLGWDMLPSLHTRIGATGTIPTVPGLPSTRPILKDEVPLLCDTDVRQLVQEWTKADSSGSGTEVTVLPDAETVTYLHTLAEFMGREQRIENVDVKGSLCEEATSWMYWYHEFKNKRLIVQRLKPATPSYAPKAESVAALLLDALREARKYDLEEVIIWSPDADVHAALAILQAAGGAQMKIATEPRETRLSCIRYRGGVNEARAALLPDEFYAWN
jgi:hypothetical protein